MDPDFERLRADIEQAAHRIAGYVYPSPLLRSDKLNAHFDANVLLKAESLQPTGSFKLRGAFNSILQLLEGQQIDRVLAFSSGNHGIGVAYAARVLNLSATIVAPNDAPRAKVDRILSLGANLVTYCRDTEDREQLAADLQRANPMPLIKPYDDWQTVCGQGSCAVEVTQEYQQRLDAAIVCTGGGGLIAGIGSYLKGPYPSIELYSAEPEGWDDHRLSLARGERIAAPGTGSTWCDGLLAPIPGELTFRMNLANGVQGLSANDDAIAEAMTLCWHTFGLRLEPSGAVALASLLSNKHRFAGNNVLVTLTGGNVDSERFFECTGINTPA